MKKIIGIFICMLMIATAVFPVAGIIENHWTDEDIFFYEETGMVDNFYMNENSFEGKHGELTDSNTFKTTIDLPLYSKTNSIDVAVNAVDSSEMTISLQNNDVYHIYVGVHWKAYITAYWVPPQEKTICLWAGTLPYHATLNPLCNCGVGSVTSVLDWTPTTDQIGENVIAFYAGESCSSATGSFTITVFVHLYIPDPMTSYELLAGDERILPVTLSWSPPQPERLICLWVVPETLPEGAIFTPCHCDHGEVTGFFNWTPTMDQIDNEYVTYFLVGDECGFYLGVFPIVFTVKDPLNETFWKKFTDPNRKTPCEQQQYFLTKLKRYKEGVKENGKIKWPPGKNSAPTSVDDILNSLGEKGEGKYVKIAEHTCPPGSKVDKIEIYVKTKFVKWDPKMAEKGSSGGCSYTEDPKISIEGKTKKVMVGFAIMLDPSYCKTTENSDDVGKLDNDRLFYHELLHAQLAVNKMKEQNWDGYDELCKCNSPKITEKMIDKNHQTITDLEVNYVKKLGESRGYIVEYRGDLKTILKNNKFEIEINLQKLPEEKQNIVPFVYNPDKNIDLNSLKYDFSKFPIVKISGTIKDPKKDAKLIVWFDPPDYGFIGHMNIFPEGSEPLKPSTPSGPSSVKVGDTSIYTTSTIDPYGYQIIYGFDWNGDDNVDNWTEYIASGDMAAMSHEWDEKGTYEIKVKAVNEYDLESEWSDVLPVTVTKSKVKNIPLFIQRLLQGFPFLNKILNQIIL